jgi:hypothetical protein
MLTPKEVEELYGIDRILVYKHGLEVIRKARYPMPKPEPPKKGETTEMSKKSKMRLAHIVQNSEVGFASIMTLTYGDLINPTDGRELKRQLNIFLNKLRHRFTIEYLWFMEFTKRGRPHIHIITTKEPTEFDRIWLAQIWSKISVRDAYIRQVKIYGGSEIEEFVKLDEFKLAEETQKVYLVHRHQASWQKAKKTDGMARYALKYATKTYQKKIPEEFRDAGRFWGVSSGVYAIPIAEVLIGETMSEEGIKQVLAQSRVGQMPLIPRYIFERDALKYFTEMGMKLTEIFGEKNVQKLDDDENL